jgi:hypothetical protein
LLIGIVTWPPAPSAANILSASASLGAEIESAKPWKFGLPSLRPSEPITVLSPI